MTKQSSPVRYILRLTLTLLLITAVVAGLLALVNHITADKIAAHTAQKAESAMQQVLPAETYDSLTVPDGGAVTAACRADGLGYVVRVAPSGFGGTIDMMVGIANDGTVAKKKSKKESFNISFENIQKFPFSDTPIPISEIAKRINELNANDNMKKFHIRILPIG